MKVVVKTVPARPQTPVKTNADPLKRHACVLAKIRFVDGNVRKFYSRDIEFKSATNQRWKYNNVEFWVQHFKVMIQNETPVGWQGRVVEAGLFRCFDGNEGEKIAQFNETTRQWEYAQP